MVHVYVSHGSAYCSVYVCVCERERKRKGGGGEGEKKEREQLDHISGFCHNLTVNTTLINEARKGSILILT